ncbi:MAG: LytTR family DNA-binding domain-containing protein [Bacteroidales bacterium]|jgi:DNA-binding LytR/AlgR family response regulator|nr:LytTR family DNA-binding domain-containing protein [Bacteroidales bacterium]MDD2264681.1 LytTR family DNA-binding domain-containing protein [Bacteroidales bacterium]MDD2832247.1 LytTR family DNA-binding domain-containing protein [Bacteroidales bacterium]MDD3209092.1 LytTR family DNA-binding domain-containing protein [Bacteroidales bacterium]MDD3697900.1 LytTR family DNA-binding domain-containing protein [Bacteroidales bacterium]
MKDIRYRVLILDDEAPARKLLEEYISHMPDLVIAGSFNNASHARSYLNKNPVDILLCDIQMPGISGLDLVRSLNSPVCVIFTTAHSRFAVEGFELDVVDYLLKPISLERFRKAIDKAIGICRRRQPDPGHILVRADYKVHRIDLSDLVYMESQHEYITYHTINEKITAYGSLKALEKNLPGERFVRIHKSFIISLDKIRSADRSKVVLLYHGQISLPIGRVYRDRLNVLYTHPAAGREY